MLALYVERAPARRRPGDPGARLRLGLALPLPGRALPELRGSPGSRTRGPRRNTSTPRRRKRGARQPADHHLRHELLRHRRRTLRPGGLRRDVRAHEELPGAHGGHRALAEARRAALRPHLHPPPARLPLRRPGRDGLDGPVLLHGGPDAVPRPPHPVPGAAVARLGLEGQRHALPEDRRGLAEAHGLATATRSSRSSGTPTAPRTPASGGPTGGCST